MRATAVAFLVGIGLMMQPVQARAEWLPGGMAIGTRVPGMSVYAPLAIADGQGGAFALWQRSDNSTATLFPFAQHVLGTGAIAQGWLPAGMPLESPHQFDFRDAIVSDGAGGLTALFNESAVADSGGLNELIQRLGPNGQPSPGWPARGVYVARNPWDEAFGQICTDGQNGAVLAWQDYRVDPYADIRATRVLGDGSTGPGWPAGGIEIADGPDPQRIVAVVSDNANGAYLVWNDEAVPEVGGWNLSVMIQHLAGNGQLAPGWPIGGMRASSAGQFETGFTAIGDGSGGLLIAWWDGREAPPGTTSNFDNYGDIYAQHFLPDGTHAPGWPDTGLPVCTANFVQRDPWMCPDGAGGALIAWQDDRIGRQQVYLQRVAGNGTRPAGWPADGVLVADNSLAAYSIRLASDAAGGAYVGWYNSTSSQRAFAQHILGNGAIAPGWATFGTLMVDIAQSSQTDVSVVPAEPGNAIIVWADFRQPEGTTIRAQKLVTDGPVPTELALVSAEASAGAVHLEWRGAGAGLQNLRVERRGTEGAWQAIGAPSNAGADVLAYEDRAVVPGSRYGYRLVDATGKSLVSEAWVDVPLAARFALAGASPNPSRAGDLSVRFSLAARAAGQLELVDLAGRRCAYRELASLEPGEHVERLAETAGFAPGLYWLRLRQGSHTATARVALVP